MKLLITGFDPFGGEKINPALEVLKLLPNSIDDIEIIKLEIPTVFYKSLETLYEAIDKVNPDVVIALGQAGGRKDISIERVAININDAGIPDNEGNQPIDEIICHDGQGAYFSTLPIKGMVKEICELGVAASVSNTAGTFVCNHLMYGLLHHIYKEGLNIRAGFIHIPFIPEQIVNRDGVPSMELETIVKGLVAAIVAVGKHKRGDIHMEGGKIH